MGIPRFATRIRNHGASRTIGRSGESRNDRAIIDGPSLAHGLLQSFPGGSRDNGGLLPQYCYSHFGEAAIEWLDILQEHGFVIEAIYFDGVLPKYKKGVRIDRLQAYVDKLVRFKAIQDEVAKTTNDLNRAQPEEQDQRHLYRAQKSLPPPPFLVFAVFEALIGSKFAVQTSVVNGEADDFCAAKAFSISLQKDSPQTTIFTNDSDLVIYGLCERIRVVRLNELTFDEDDDGGAPTLRSLEFWPSHLRDLPDGDRIPDLVRPAFLMLQDPYLTFRNALVEAERGSEPFLNKEFKAFAATYNLTGVRGHLEALWEDEKSGHDLYRHLDSRVCELLRGAVRERDRIRAMRDWYATEDTRLLEQTKADLAEGWSGGRGSDVNEIHAIADDGVAGGNHARGVDARDFAYDQKELDLKPADMEMFLPMLHEDPSRATPWKVGVTVREVAMHLATAICGSTATVYEYKRSGRRIREMACQQISSNVCDQRLREWTACWRVRLGRREEGGTARSWKVLTMQHMLADMARDGMTLPCRDAVVAVFEGAPVRTWEAVHCTAQYQAAYYSLRILKQMSSFVRSSESSGEDASRLPQHTVAAVDLLHTLPGIGTFFDTDDVSGKEDHCAWYQVAERLLQDVNVASEPASNVVPAERGRKKRKNSKSVRPAKNVCSALEDAEA